MRRNRKVLLIALGISVVLINVRCFNIPPHFSPCYERSRYPSLYDQLETGGCRVVTVKDIGCSLPDVPISVGFDIDDTVLLSSPAFYYGSTNKDSVGGRNIYGESFTKSDQFWLDLNTSLDKFSMPKPIAKVLIEMHKSRGDSIYFITARYKTESENLTALLDNVFSLNGQHIVVFTDEKPKTPEIIQNGIDLYYGDSDGDIRDAQEAGARAIRIIRSPLSTNLDPTHPGAFGEEVLFGSEY